ncbi:MAG: CBS domain-containing protein [Nitrospirota bacterium]
MTTAKDIMSKDVYTVTTDMTIEKLARILAKHRISGAPVLDDNGKLIGIVTENDLISQKKRLHIPTIINLFDSIIYLENPRHLEEDIKKMAGIKVGDICTRKVVAIKEDTSLEEIATTMAEKGIHLLPVMRGDKIVGIVGKADIVKAIAKGI